jgi:hypothetical protein
MESQTIGLWYTMSDQSNEDWVYKVIPQKQADEINERMERIYEDETTMFNITMVAPRSSAIELCKMFDKAMGGDYNSAVSIIGFVSHIVYMIQEELHNDGIDPFTD